MPQRPKSWGVYSNIRGDVCGGELPDWNVPLGQTKQSIKASRHFVWIVAASMYILQNLDLISSGLK